jgi:hypothetical protein
MKLGFAWLKRFKRPISPLAPVTRPGEEIGDFLRVEAIAKCEEALDLAERAEVDMAAYFLECAIHELRYGASP